MTWPTAPGGSIGRRRAWRHLPRSSKDHMSNGLALGRYLRSALRRGTEHRWETDENSGHAWYLQPGALLDQRLGTETR